jgi:hypothetical protein
LAPFESTIPTNGLGSADPEQQPQSREKPFITAFYPKPAALRKRFLRLAAPSAQRPRRPARDRRTILHDAGPHPPLRRRLPGSRPHLHRACAALALVSVINSAPAAPFPRTVQAPGCPLDRASAEARAAALRRATLQPGDDVFRSAREEAGGVPGGFIGGQGREVATRGVDAPGHLGAVMADGHGHHQGAGDGAWIAANDLTVAGQQRIVILNEQTRDRRKYSVSPRVEGARRLWVRDDGLCAKCHRGRQSQGSHSYICNRPGLTSPAWWRAWPATGRSVHNRWTDVRARA